MKLSKFLSKFSIRTQILIGFVPVILILAFFISTSFQKFGLFSRDLQSLEVNTEENITFLVIERDINELQRANLVYAYVGYNGILKKISHLEENLDSQFAHIEDIALGDDELKGSFDSLYGHYDDYKEGFQNVIQKRQKMQSIQDNKLLPFADRVHAHLDKALNYRDHNEGQHILYSSAQSNFLRAQMHVQSFQNSPDASLIRKADRLLEGIKNSVAGTPGSKTLIDDIDLYKQAFSELVNVNRTYLHLINVVLAGKASEIDRLAKELDTLSQQRKAELRDAINQNIKTSKQGFIIFAIIAAVASLLSALLVATGISRPVKAMTMTLSRLSHGHPDIEIPERDRQDEVGKMAEAANAFKNMAESLENSKIQIQENLQFQNLISENIPDFIFVKDENFRIVQANPAFLSVYPEDKRDMVIGYTTIEDYDEEQANEFLKNDKVALDEGYSEVEENITFPSGDVKTLLTKKVRFENANGEPFILAVARDITQNKKAEDEIMRSNEELERFAYIASHDLQEPLRMVSNFTGLLNKEYGEDMGPEARQYMNFSIDAAKRMQELISDLLEYSRAGDEDAGMSEFNSEERFEYAIANLKTTIEETGTTITMGSLPEIYAHPMRFSRLVQNIIGNALKYRDPARKPEIKIATKERDKDWLFSIADNGIGIKEEYLEQIFVIFKRLHHKQEYSGTGLGLAICKKIVEGFGGQLWVESKFGQGSVFYFTIPKGTR